jgi:hypothetical protein
MQRAIALVEMLRPLAPASPLLGNLPCAALPAQGPLGLASSLLQARLKSGDASSSSKVGLKGPRIVQKSSFEESPPFPSRPHPSSLSSSTRHFFTQTQQQQHHKHQDTAESIAQARHRIFGDPLPPAEPGQRSVREVLTRPLRGFDYVNWYPQSFIRFDPLWEDPNEKL